MTNQLIINGKDAAGMWGVSMGEGFLEALFTPEPLKEFVACKSREEHGKEVHYYMPRLDEREITLVFYIRGETPQEYLKNFKAFKEELHTGKVELAVSSDADRDIYRLTYEKSAGFALNPEQTFSKLSVKFNEPNPGNRKGAFSK